jgi:hypothetical protein
MTAPGGAITRKRAMDRFLQRSEHGDLVTVSTGPLQRRGAGRSPASSPAFFIFSLSSLYAQQGCTHWRMRSDSIQLARNPTTPGLTG